MQKTTNSYATNRANLPTITRQANPASYRDKSGANDPVTAQLHSSAGILPDLHHNIGNQAVASLYGETKAPITVKWTATKPETAVSTNQQHDTQVKPKPGIHAQ